MHATEDAIRFIETTASSIRSTMFCWESKGETDGQTPLPWAVRNGYEAMMKLLIEKGADPKSKDKGSAVVGGDDGHEVVVRLLRPHYVVLP